MSGDDLVRDALARRSHVERATVFRSAAEIAALVRTIRSTRVRAVLSEVQFNPAVARTIASETGIALVTDLYTDSVGDPPLDTYEAIVRWDTERIAAALRQAAGPSADRGDPKVPLRA